MFLYELVYTLQNDYGITTDRRTVARFLVSQGFTRKQVGGVSATVTTLPRRQ